MIPCSFCTRHLSLVRLAAGLLLIALLIPAAAFAQPEPAWSLRFNRSGLDIAGCAICNDNSPFLGFKEYVRGRQATVTDGAGNVYVTGSTGTANGLGNEDVLTVKYNPQGDVLWARAYDGGNADQGFAVTVDANGYVVVTGRSWVPSELGLEGKLLVLRYRRDGVQEYAKVFSFGVRSAGFAVAVDRSGNVYVAGEILLHDSEGQGPYHSMVVLMYTQSGAFGWVNLPTRDAGGQESSAYDIALDNAGNVYATGFIQRSADPVIRDYMTVKYSPSTLQGGGVLLWIRLYDTGGNDEAYDVAVDGGGNVHVAGTSGVVRYDAAGTQQWVGPFDGVAHALITEGGFTYATGVSGSDIVTARYDATGARLWSTPYDLGGVEEAYALRLVGDSVYVAGFAGNDVLVVGFDRDLGGSTLVDLYDSGGLDRAWSMASDASDFWVVGRARDDFLTIKYTFGVVSGPNVHSLTLIPSAIAGGCKTSMGTVTLTLPAPAGGAVVTLTNTNPAASMPASVTVPAGATTAKFTITSSTVTASQTGTVTATYGVSKSATLTVRPMGVLSLALSPNPVVGPNGVVGTVTLECPAAPGNIVVSLTTSNAAVAKPAVTSITIPAGSATGTFNVTTADVSAVSSATIRATSSGVWKAVELTVNP